MKIRRIYGIIAGLVAGMIIIVVLQIVSAILNPLPQGMDVNDRNAMQQFVSTLPISAFLLVIFSHSLGSFVAALICTIVAREPWLFGALVCGGLLLMGGISNLLMIPHPTWFAVVDLVLYIPAALLGYLVAGKFIKTPV